MGKLRCPCGRILSNTPCPNEVTGLLLRDVDVEVYDPEKDPEPGPCLCDLGRGVWECPGCGRLGFDNPGPARHVIWYTPEDGRPRGLLSRAPVGDPDPPA